MIISIRRFFLRESDKSHIGHIHCAYERDLCVAYGAIDLVLILDGHNVWPSREVLCFRRQPLSVFPNLKQQVWILTLKPSRPTHGILNPFLDEIFPDLASPRPIKCDRCPSHEDEPTDALGDGVVDEGDHIFLRLRGQGHDHVDGRDLFVGIWEFVLEWVWIS